MQLDIGTALRVLAGTMVAIMLHGCNDSANSASGNDATLTIAIPHVSSTNQVAARAGAPDYIKTITIAVLDSAGNVIVPSRDLPASGGQLALSVPANLALHLKGVALDQKRLERFSGNKAVQPIAAGATTAVSLTLDALTPLSAAVQTAESGNLTVTDNTTNVTVITTNAQEDQYGYFTQRSKNVS